MESIRAFICAEVPDECKDLILEKAKRLNAGNARFVGRDQLHITLFFFAKITLDKVDEVKKMVQQLSSKSFNIEISGFDTFNPNRPTVVFAKVNDSGHLLNIYNQLAPGISELGLELEDREFTPHLTVARVRDANRTTTESIEAFVSESKTEICSFTCKKIKLMQSNLSEKGPAYIELYSKQLA